MTKQDEAASRKLADRLASLWREAQDGICVDEVHDWETAVEGAEAAILAAPSNNPIAELIGFGVRWRAGNAGAIACAVIEAREVDVNSWRAGVAESAAQLRCLEDAAGTTLIALGLDVYDASAEEVGEQMLECKNVAARMRTGAPIQ